jgi:hypothetical protein
MSASQLPCPLNDEHCQQMRTAMAAVNQAKQYCAKCRAAGLDMSSYETLLQQQHDVLTGIKQQFFPLES